MSVAVINAPTRKPAQSRLDTVAATWCLAPGKKILWLYTIDEIDCCYITIDDIKEGKGNASE
jgi:hypothetical protein